MQATTGHKPRSEKTHRQRRPSGWPGIVFSALLRVGHGGDDAFRWQNGDYDVERCSDGRVILSPAAAELLANVIRREVASPRMPSPPPDRRSR
jgi:phosphoribosyl 1,2-cyclic phosphodiesterase